MILRLALRNVFRGRARFLLSTFIVAVASFLLVYATGQILGVRSTLAKGMTDTLTGHIQVKPKSAPKDFFDFSTPRSLQMIPAKDVQEILSSLKRVEGVEAAAPRIRFGSLIGNDDRSVPALIMAVDPVAEALVSPDLGEMLKPLSDPGAALISPMLLKKSAAKEGEEILAFTDTANESFNARPYRIAGLASAPVLIDEFMNALFIVNLSSARQLLYVDGGATDIAIRLKPGHEARAAEVVKEIGAVLSASQQQRLAVYPYWEVAKSIQNISGIAAGVGALQVGVVMLVMLVIVLIVTKMGLHERRAEIGTLMSLGMTRQRLAALFVGEVAIKILIGYGTGLVLALLALKGVHEQGGIKAVTGVDQYMYGGKVMFPVIDAEAILIGFLLLMAAAVAVTLASCWKAGGQDAVELLSSKR